MRALEKYTSKRFKRLHALLKSFPGKDVKESNHKIRLEIKRIKAVLGLIHFHNKKFQDHTHYIPFRDIFRMAGHMREAGLQQELLEQYTHSHTPFYRSPVKGTGKFRKKIPKMVKATGKHEKLILEETGNIKRWLYYTYIQRKKSALTEQINKGYTASDLHFMRKQIKELIYLTSIDKFLTTEPLLTSMAEVIGNWHDKVLLMEFLKTDAHADQKTLKELKTETDKDLKKLRLLTKEYAAKNRVRPIRIKNIHNSKKAFRKEP